jgi:hypothetical protein
MVGIREVERRGCQTCKTMNVLSQLELDLIPEHRETSIPKTTYI